MHITTRSGPERPPAWSPRESARDRHGAGTAAQPRGGNADEERHDTRREPGTCSRHRRTRHGGRAPKTRGTERRNSAPETKGAEREHHDTIRRRMTSANITAQTGTRRGGQHPSEAKGRPTATVQPTTTRSVVGGRGGRRRESLYMGSAVLGSLDCTARGVVWARDSSTPSGSSTSPYRPPAPHPRRLDRDPEALSRAGARNAHWGAPSSRPPSGARCRGCLSPEGDGALRGVECVELFSLHRRGEVFFDNLLDDALSLDELRGDKCDVCTIEGNGERLIVRWPAARPPAARIRVRRGPADALNPVRLFRNHGVAPTASTEPTLPIVPLTICHTSIGTAYASVSSPRERAGSMNPDDKISPCEGE